MTTISTTESVLAEVLAERQRQDAKWGEQNHPLISPNFQSAITYEANASFMKSVNDRLAEEGKLGWDSILLEEVYEALAETDPVKAREELIQVIAVACGAVESLDRNELAGRR